MADQSYLNWPFLEPAHKSLAQEMDAWASEHIAPLEAAPHEDVDGVCAEILSRLAGAGWLDHAAPADGGDHDVRALCLIRQTLAYHSGLADFVFAMQGLGSGPIQLFGSPQQQELLAGVRAGKKVAAFALSEPDAGSDVAATSTSAKRNGDGYILNGEKTFISNGGIADFYCVFARTGEGDGAKGLSAFLVRADNPGLDIAERIDVIAPHPLARLKFSNCHVGGGDMIGAPGEGFKVAMATLDVFRSTVGAAALGFARRALDEAITRSKSRKMFGATLGDMQITQAAIAEMALEIDASALLIYRAAWQKDTSNDRITREAAMAKLHATETAQKVADKAVQMFGGQGVVSGEMVEKLYREVRALRIYEGASEVQKIVIARQVLAEVGDN